MTRLRIAGIIALFVLIAACGQKPGVGDVETAAPGAGASGGAFDDLGQPKAPTAGTGGSAGAEEASGTGAGTATGGATAGAGGGATGTGGSTGGGSTATGGGTTGGGTTGGGAAAGDRTGITDKVIKIGIHAPVTGAAPFPVDSFNKGKDVYFKFLAAKGGVFGRNVEVVFRDDEFNPSTAVKVCRQMVEQEKVFLLVGGGGADQITACAKYANSVGVPYLSAGVNEDELATLRGYFATSQSYLQQAVPLAQLAAKKLGGGKLGILVEDTPSFRGAKAAFEKAAAGAGLQVVYNKFISKGASDSEVLTKASELSQSGARIVYVLIPPTVFIKLAQAGQSQAYNPSYIGPGITNGLNTVATAGCPGIGSANFLSPFPQLDVIDRLDPNFRPSYQKYGGGDPDDIGIALWGIDKLIGTMLQAAGKDVSRQSFVQLLESGRRFETGVYPPVQFSAKNHFGGQAFHLLTADCGSRSYKTTGTFLTGF